MTQFCYRKVIEGEVVTVMFYGGLDLSSNHNSQISVGARGYCGGLVK
jgi:hypothetical protein